VNKTQLKQEIDWVAKDIRSYLADDSLPSSYMLGFYKGLVEAHDRDYDPLTKEGVLTKEVEDRIRGF